jgi:lipoprotein-anchoring transpeptidase ErfK/SrfK
MHFLRLFAAASVILLAACDQDAGSSQKPAHPASAPAKPASATAPAEANVDQAVLASPALRTDDRSPDILRVEVLLDRARFSPGEIDAAMGENLKNALSAFQRQNGLPVTGAADPATLQKLAQGDGRPVIRQYTITAQDVAGPFLKIPTDFKAQSEMPAMSYQTPQEMLAERFHMSQDLLAALNPGVDFGKAGTVVKVAAVTTPPLPAQVAVIEVDKQAKMVRALGEDGKLIAAFPGTIGSTERPAPTGDYHVTGVSWNPTYTFDPKRLTFSHPGVHGKTTVKAGPNNPVGLVWIALSIPTYGIHGSPEPHEIGKTASHGCIRLTNWDIEELASGVKAGAKVSFITKSSDSAQAKGPAGSGDDDQSS